MLSIIHRADEDSLEKMQEEMTARKTKEVFLLFAMGSQTDGLIAQEVAKLGVYCLPANPKTMTADDVRKVAPVGIIISGGPYSVYSETEPVPFDSQIFELRIPVLGICLGFQMWAYYRRVTVQPAAVSEYGGHRIRVSHSGALLFFGIPDSFIVWQSHSDEIAAPDRGILGVLARSERGLVAAGEMQHLHGVQFHPEVSDTEYGAKLLGNFCFRICGAQDCFPAQDIAERKIVALREQIGDKRVLIALSGGSDSSVVAFLFERALEGRKGQARGVYLKGLDRPDDEAHVRKHFGDRPWLQLKLVDATAEFLDALRGKESAHEKRLAMKGAYREVLEREIRAFGASFIAQGTLYTDLSESGEGMGSPARKAVIKVHHNTGNTFSVPELIPLADLVKDSARSVGRALGVPEELLTRHPFPGPGLSIRVEGKVTAERLTVARAVDRIWIEEIRRSGAYQKVWQAGADITRSVVTCTKGDEARMGMCIELWAVASVNGFTARPFQFEVAFLEQVATRIAAEVPEVGSVSFVVMPKPPRTIERG